MKKTFKEFMNEARQDALDYKYTAKKGGKALEPGHKSIKRIEVAISNKDMPGNLGSVFGTMAAAKKKLDDLKKEYSKLDTEAREKVKGLADQIFDESDAMFTRVIETANTIISINKASERTDLDNKVFQKLLKEYFTDSVDIIDELAEKASITKTVKSSVKIEPKKIDESIGDKFKSIMDKVVKGFKKLKDRITKNNKKGNELIRMAIKLSK